MNARTYPSPQAFKQALEQRLRTSSSGGADFARRRQLLVFQRFLARVSRVLGDTAILKGGLVLELRLQRARTTKDVDLRLTGCPADLLDLLQRVAREDLTDFFTFEMRPDDHLPDIRNDGMKYDGLRFRAEAKLAGKLYGQPFGVDVAFGDPLVGSPDRIAADDVLAFAGISPPTLLVYPIETHIAEKLHAYTMPRTRPNSRVKDLPDIALLASTGPLDAKKLRAALSRTFEFRATHSLPNALPAPPPNWEAPYAAMARTDELPWRTLGDVVRAAQAFLDPVIASEADGSWDPNTWHWA